MVGLDCSEWFVGVKGADVACLPADLKAINQTSRRFANERELRQNSAIVK
jgi:hypothetical protein